MVVIKNFKPRYSIVNSYVLVKFTELKRLQAMVRGRKPRVCADDVWDHIKGIPTPLHDQLTIIIEKLQKIQIRERGLLDFEAALKGKEVKACKRIEEELLTLEDVTNDLDILIERCALWLVKRRKARKQ